MLAIQQLLKNNECISHLDISVKKHDTLPLSIYNYCQIDSDKKNEAVQNCRGLVLDDQFNIVASAFHRFFNLGEMPELHSKFNWNNFTCQSKEDGSLILVYKYQGQIFVNTRATFGDGNVNGSDKTWRGLVEEAILPLKLEDLFDNLTEVPQTYVFELVGMYNQVVRAYQKTGVYLLSAFSDKNEWSYEKCDELARFYGLNRPQLFEFKSINEIQSFLKTQEEADPTFEGVICRDDSNMRLKIKSASYLRLHRTVNNGNLFLAKNLVPNILNNEIDEILCYFEHLKPEVDRVRALLEDEKQKLLCLWNEVKDIVDQKQFALKVVDSTKFSSIMFSARKLKVCPSVIWHQSADLIVKVLF